MGNALFVVLLSVDHETSNEFLGMFARKEDAFGFMEKCVKSAIRSNTFVLEDGRWTNGAVDSKQLEQTLVEGSN